MHFSYSTDDPKDALHHQRQVLLRNASNPEAGLLSLLYLLWAWKKNASQPYRRLLLVFLGSVFCVVGFTLASGFSSSISTAIGSEVLLSGSNCAIQDVDALNSISYTERTTYFEPWRAKLWSSAAEYARKCYSNGASQGPKGLECGTFATQRLTVNITSNAPCPFDPSICKSQDQNLVLDTGLLDSHAHFGINAPPQDRFMYRQRMHCAPLVTGGYTSRFNLSTDRSYTRYHYGTRWGDPLPDNFTYEKSNDAEIELRQTQLKSTKSDYSIG
jgi:hypothetical protein